MNHGPRCLPLLQVNVTTRYYPGNPKMPIFVAQGPMQNGATLTGALTAAITQAAALGINATFLDMRGLPDDGCAGHPGPLGHQAMFEAARPQIAKVMGW
jgi:hypothetical protein